MAEDNSSGKWAAESFDFLRLFQRIGSQFSGFIMLEIGWALLLLLVAKLSASDATPVIGLPWISANGGFVARDVRLTTLFPVGSIGLALIWFFTSGLYLIVWMPIARCFRFLGVAIVTILVIALVILTLPIAFISFFVEEYLFRRWKKKVDPEKLQQIVRDHGETTLREVAKKAMKFDAMWLQNWIGNQGHKLMSRWASVGFVGLAPLYSYSYDEDLFAAKAPLQVFAEAIGRLRLKLKNLDAIHFLRFQSLPHLIRVTSHPSAEWLRKWLGLDALLWGSYLSVAPPKIWLNIEQRLTPVAIDQEKSKNWLEIDPLQSSMNLDRAMVVADQNDPFDVYIVLVIALMEALKSRRETKWHSRFKWQDKLYLSGTAVDDIVTHLVRDVLLSLPVTPLKPDKNYPSAKEVLVEIGGKWIATALEGRFKLQQRTERYQLLEEVAQKCVQLKPEDSDNYYRLAVLQCLLDKETKALNSMKAAFDRDKNAKWADEVELMVHAQMDMFDLDIEGSRAEIKLAKAAIHVARAITFAKDKERERKYLLEDFQKSEYFTFRQFVDKPLSAAENILYHYLDMQAKMPVA